MPRHRLPATLLPAALSAATFAMAPAAAAEKPQEKAHSVVAQSTEATAATGRKPLAKRIAAANQPIRTSGPEWPIPGTEPAAAVVAPLGDALGTATADTTAAHPVAPPALPTDPALVVDVPHPAESIDPAIALPGTLDEALVVVIAPAEEGDGPESEAAVPVLAAADPLAGADDAAPADAIPEPAVAATPRRVATVPRVNAALVTPPETPSSTPILDRFRDTLARWPRPFGLLSGSDTVAHTHQPSAPARTRQAQVQPARPRSASRRPTTAPIAVADGPAVEPTEAVTPVIAETIVTDSSTPGDDTVQWVAAETGADSAVAESAGIAVPVVAESAPTAAIDPDAGDRTTAAGAEVLALVAGDPALPTDSPTDEQGADEPSAGAPAADALAARALDSDAPVETADPDSSAIDDHASATDPAPGDEATATAAVATTDAGTPAASAPAPVPRTHLAEHSAARHQPAPQREVLIDRLRGAFNRLPRPLGLIPRAASQAGAVAARPAPSRQARPHDLAGRTPNTRGSAGTGAPLPTTAAIARTVDPASASVPLADDGAAPATSGTAAAAAVTTAGGVPGAVEEPHRDEAAAAEATTDSVALELTGLPETIGVDAPFEFTIAIHNASDRAIRGVVARVFFAEGIEPVAAEGLAARLAPGVIAFDAIARIEAGETATATIRAVGVAATAVDYRIDLSCAELETPLATDGTVTVTAPEAP